ncbi:hypothetical protein AUEXF2481DRAFT_35007 [Aureobasidium subglaciale EXF-2481]|uniref:Uncharacterized protein n=1 Tax=Aureobasidium subglaciale (strain EXF-2481) TaxID=1043005 RepID=A0A074Z397_AURSE|nr:uncharacterized protein AUEXF2481DRAFT_35007 [Aureobasidium subglaciale EXF-2481]KER00758.1 hypothetical protein AUEXF2481DRAFT_35007 [Aureobasidium subglaciale EXF-2481]
MPRSQHLLPLLLPWLVTAGPLPASTHTAPNTNAITHANYIFNAVHDSMRQFGSSLNHNGMSLFMATVPEGTEFYHGTSERDRINGTQWLAFEPEHALIFARGHRGPPPGHSPSQEPPPPSGVDDKKPKGPYFPDGSPKSSARKHIGGDGKERFAGEIPEHRGSKDGKKRPGKNHDDKCHGPSRNDTRPDVPHRGPPPHPPHRGPPPPHHGPPPPHHCPPGEGHLPCGGPPDEGHHGPPRRGPPFDHHGPPPEWFEHRDHHDEHHGDYEHHEHHGPPPHEFFDELNDPHHDHRDNDDHHGGFPLPPIGFWVHRLGDLLRNPKRRHTPVIDSISSPLPPVTEKIETRAEQEPLVTDVAEDQDSGFLHTYRTKHSLRLLYVDGQSAAKSQKGTLDTQDVLLLENSIDHDSGMFGEKERANQMCNMAHEQWGDRIDGILRMEGGFEIILCDFAAHLDVVSIAKTNPKASGGFGGGGGDGDGFNYYRAVAARYHGIGGERVVLDYENFVSAFAYPEAIYFDKTGRPRLNNASTTIENVREAVDKMVLRKDSDVETVDWQAVADMIIARYADRIEYLTAGSLTTLEAFQAEVERALRPFIDYSARNSSSEIDRCADQFIPEHISTTTTSIAAQAIRQVTNTICSSLLNASEQVDLDTALDQVKQLKEYLSWSTWKQCHGCAADEICFLPIWPVGTAEDFKQPKCRSGVSLAPGRGSEDRYWNDFGGPGRKGPGSQKRRKKTE